MQKQNFLSYPLLFMGTLLVLTGSCKKDDQSDKIPQISTAEVTSIYQVKAQCGGLITSDAGFAITARGVCWNTTGNPTITDNKTTDGLGAGSFSSKLTGLAIGTTYYARAYATNSQGTAYGSTMVFKTLGTTFTDPRDGNVYKIVTIGNQLWMAENLRYLPSVVGPETGSQTTPYYYVYNYNSTSVTTAKTNANYTTYGVLYNWPAAMAGSSSSTANPSGVKGISPEGWHLPSDAEWTELTDYLGGEEVAGDKLKEAGTAHWADSYAKVTNESGFTALPGGWRDKDKTFQIISCYGAWWSATEVSAINALDRSLFYGFSEIFRGNYTKELGFSVRCVKD